MALFWVNGQIVDDQEGHVPEGSQRVNTFTNKGQYGDQEFSWDPQQRHFSGNIERTSPGYLTTLFGMQDRLRSGQLKPYEIEGYQEMAEKSRAIPTRDIGSLTAGWQGEKDDPNWWNRLDPLSPDVGPITLQLKDKIDAGTATDKERELFHGVMQMAGDWDWRASVPQASDAFNPLGDQFFSALGVLGLGATGGLAAAPLFAGGAGLTTTLGSLGTLAGIGGTAAGALGQEMDQEWLKKLGMGLGAAGGIAGGIGGIANLANTGITSLGDAARLAGNVGRVTSGIGNVADADLLKEIGNWLGTAGQLGGGIDTLSHVFGDGVKDLTDVARLASGLGKVTGVAGRVTGNKPLQQASGILGMGSQLGGVGNLLGAANQAQRQGVQATVPRPMTDADWLRWTGEPGPWELPQSILGNL